MGSGSIRNPPDRLKDGKIRQIRRRHLSWRSDSTSHYDYVCSEVSKGIAAISLESGIPVLFGVLTTDSIEQAIERAGSKAGNKGSECAMGAIEMVSLIRELDRESAS